MAQAVKVDIKLSSVKMAEMMMTIPAQKLIRVWSVSIKARRISVVTPAELKRTPSSADRSKLMNTMLLAYLWQM
jgi:hypothetical protein